jgi:hypothetical protein
VLSAEPGTAAVGLMREQWTCDELRANRREDWSFLAADRSAILRGLWEIAGSSGGSGLAAAAPWRASAFGNLNSDSWSNPLRETSGTRRTRYLSVGLSV